MGKRKNFEMRNVQEENPLIEVVLHMYKCVSSMHHIAPKD